MSAHLFNGLVDLRAMYRRAHTTPLAGLISGLVEYRCGHGGVREPVHARTFQTQEPGGPVGFRFQWVAIAEEIGTVRKRFRQNV